MVLYKPKDILLKRKKLLTNAGCGIIKHGITA